MAALPCSSGGVEGIIVDLTGDPQTMQQEHREFPSHRHYRPLPGVLAAPFGDLFSVTPEIGVLPECSEDVVSASHQEPSEQLVAVSGDAPLGVAISGLW